MRSRVLCLTAAFACLLLAGCSDTREVKVRVQGVKPLNINEAGESTPVNVRVYGLRTDARFRAATVDQLWTDPEKTLADEVTGPAATFTVFPGEAGDETVVHVVQVKKTAQWLGILAMYAKSDAQDRRTEVLTLDDLGDKVLVFTGSAVQAQDPQKKGTTSTDAPKAGSN